MTSSALDPAIRELAATLARMQARIGQLERNQIAAQLDLASIEAGGLTINDANGDPQIVIGLQDDGTFAHVAVAASDPAAPSDPVVQAGITGLYVIWDGLMQDASQPLSDFDSVQVHVSQVSGFTPDQTTLQGSLHAPGMFGVGSLTAGVPYYAVLVPVNTAGISGDPSHQATATPTAVPDNIPPGTVTGAMIGSGAVTGNNIAAGSIAAVHIAAGTVVAGIIDATVVNAAVFNGSVFNGTDFTLDSQGERYYSGFPGSGNLVASISPAAYTDQFGNACRAGIASYGTAGPFPFAELLAGQLLLGDSGSVTNASVFGTGGSLTLGSGTIASDTAGRLALLSKQDSNDGVHPELVSFQRIQVQDETGSPGYVFTTDPGSPNADEVPHAFPAFQNSWATGNRLGNRYRLVASPQGPWRSWGLSRSPLAWPEGS